MLSRDELRAKLKAKIHDKKMSRSNKQYKEHIVDTTLTKVGIDKDEFKKNLEIFKKMKPHERESVLRKSQENKIDL